MINTSSLTKEIKAIGVKLGFSHIGIANPDLHIWDDRFREWLSNGFAGKMRYLARDTGRRADPLSIFPETGSIVVVSMNYYPGDRHREDLDNTAAGYIANYALNEDYHPFIESRLRALLQHIDRFTDGRVQGKIYVDTGPILEKPLAVKAGVGWMGKHTLLISPDTGSWLLLGVLLLDTELDFDEPVTDNCGECVKCMDVCPTRAIVAPYILDARLCISYLLGELKGPIPVEMRHLIGNRIFGCDDCQWACPRNVDAGISPEKPFQPKKELMTPLLIDLMEMEEDKYDRAFNNNPIKRLKRRRFLRNVTVALGNSGDRRAIPVLSKRLTDPDPLVREHVGWALRQIPGG